MIGPRAALWAALLAAASPASAHRCANPCGVAAGDLCASLMVVGVGFRRSQVVAVGDIVRLQVGRQKGLCGGLELLKPDEVQATVQRAVVPPPKSTPFLGADLTWTPNEAGTFYFTVGAKDGRGVADKRVVHVLAAGGPPKVPLKVVPPPGARGGWLEVRRVPDAADEVVHAGFVRARWPLFVEGELPGAAVEPRLPPGRYEATWRSGEAGKLAAAAARFEVIAGKAAEVVLPAAAVRVKTPAGGGARLLTVRGADGAVAAICVPAGSKEESIALHGAGELVVGCAKLPDGAPCAAGVVPPAATATLKEGARFEWPEACR